MKLTIEMNLDNAAFTDGNTDEIERIVVDLCTRLPYPLADTNGDLNLRDLNGNHCGTARIEE